MKSIVNLGKMAFLFPSLALLLALAACTKNPEDPILKTLTFALTDDAKSLDPAVAYDTVGMDVIPLGVESLLQYKYTKTPLELEPLIAEEIPQISNGGKTYTIKIKKGVLWHDDPIFPGGKGRELKASDFLYAWKRLALPEIQSPGTWIFNDRVEGWNAFRQEMISSKTPNEFLKKEISGMKALDDYTIQVKLLSPYPQFLHILTMAYTAPVLPEYLEKNGQFGFTNTFLGTGPYRLQEYTKGSKFVLVKNPTYRGEKYPADGDALAKSAGLMESAGKMMPFVDKITFEIFKEDQPRWLQFMRGNLDVSGIPKDNFSSAIDRGELRTEMAQKGIQFLKLEQASLYYLLFNMKDPLVGGKNVFLRKAISQVVNREEFIELFRNGRGIKATSLIPRVVEGTTPRKELPGDFNLEEAKLNLAKAGYPGGRGLPALRFDLRGTSANYRLQAEFIKNALEKIGVKMEILQNSFPGYLEKERKGNLQFLMTVWDSDYPDPQDFLALLYSKNVSPGPNISSYQNPDFDKLYEKIASLNPSEARTKLIYQAEELVYKDEPWAPMFYPLAFSLGHGWVRNFRPNIQITNHMKYFDVDLDLKRKLKAKLN